MTSFFEQFFILQVKLRRIHHQHLYYVTKNITQNDQRHIRSIHELLLIQPRNILSAKVKDKIERERTQRNISYLSR